MKQNGPVCELEPILISVRFGFQVFCLFLKGIPVILGQIVQSGVKLTQGWVKFEFSYESLKGKFSLILFVNNVMTGRSKRNRENYPIKCF